MREREKDTGFIGKETIGRANDRERQQEAQEKGWSPPPIQSLCIHFKESNVWSTGSQISVFTYEPMSSLSPFPGPHLCLLISKASRIFRSYASFFLDLPCAEWITVVWSTLKGCVQCWWCWLIPECPQFSLRMAPPCSFHLMSHARAVCPM